MTPDIVQTQGLTKRYGEFSALSDCSVTVARGEVFGLLGPNGAGKTTLIRLLLGYLQPTSGQLFIDGIDPRSDGVELRKRVAYLPGDARLPRHMKGGNVLRFFSEMHPSGNLDRSLEVAKRLELDTRIRVAFMSTGMRQKLALAVVFGVDTPLLILDEPTANLDPTVRANVLQLVMDAKQAGRTVMFSSHVLSEIEETCDRVAFLRKGKLAHRLTMKDLYQRHRITAQFTAPATDPVTAPVAAQVTAQADQTQPEINVPETLASRIHTSIDGPSVSIVTDGDLAPMLSWVDSLSLSQVRIEPLGLRAVYDAVHSGQEVAV